MRLGRDDAPDGVKSVLSGLPRPLAAVMPVTLRSCSVPGHEGSPKSSARFVLVGPPLNQKLRRKVAEQTSPQVGGRRHCDRHSYPQGLCKTEHSPLTKAYLLEAGGESDGGTG